MRARVHVYIRICVERETFGERILFTEGQARPLHVSPGQRRSGGGPFRGGSGRGGGDHGGGGRGGGGLRSSGVFRGRVGGGDRGGRGLMPP